MPNLQTLQDLPELVSRLWLAENQERLTKIYDGVQDIYQDTTAFATAELQEAKNIADLVVDLILDVGFGQKGSSLNADYSPALYDAIKANLLS